MPFEYNRDTYEDEIVAPEKLQEQDEEIHNTSVYGRGDDLEPVSYD